MNKKIGRPTRYKPEYCQEIIKFFDIEPHFETPVVITYKDGTTKEEVKFIPSDLPLLSAFANKLKTHRSTIFRWAKKHKEFRNALKRAKDCQREILITNGLKGLYSTSFAIFTAKNLIGWRDKTEVSGDADRPLGVVILPKIYDDQLATPSGAADRSPEENRV